MTMPQPAMSNGITAEMLTRLEAELVSARRSHEARLEEGPEVDDDISLALHRRSEQALAEIVAALTRIEDGSYATCGACLGPISLDRLEAMPHARVCMNCVRRDDRML